MENLSPNSEDSNFSDDEESGEMDQEADLEEV